MIRWFFRRDAEDAKRREDRLKAAEQTIELAATVRALIDQVDRLKREADDADARLLNGRHR